MNDTRHLKLMIHALDITQTDEEALDILLSAGDSAAQLFKKEKEYGDKCKKKADKHK